MQIMFCIHGFQTKDKQYRVRLSTWSEDQFELINEDEMSAVTKFCEIFDIELIQFEVD